MQNKLLTSLVATALISNSPNSLSDETITVTTSRLTLPITATLNDVIVIDADEIAATSALTLFDLLQAKPGVDWVRKGGPGQEISMFVRGSGTNQLLVLMDGVEIGSATLGYKALSDINLAHVARIEIVKGPRAAIWGSKAIGGVMQIFSRKDNTTQLSLGVGSFNEQNLSLATGFREGNFQASLSLDTLKSDGIDARLDGDPDRDGIERDNLNLMANYELNAEQKITFRYLATEGETQYDSFFGDDTLKIDNDLISLQYLLTQADNSHQLLLARQTDASITLDDGAALFSFETISESLRYLFDSKQSEHWSLGSSIEYLHEDVGNSSTSYNEDQRSTLSGHIYSHYQAEHWVNEIALRYTDVEDLESNLSLHAGLGFRPTEEHLISFNYGEGFKVPTFNDLYFPFGGNPNLENEVSENMEVVYKYWSANGTLSLSIYDNDIENLIQFIPDENGVFTANNVGQANLQGADLGYSWQTSDISHEINAQYVDAKDSQNERPLQLRVKSQFGYQVKGRLYPDLNYQLGIQHIGERPDFDYQTFIPIQLASFTQLNINLGYRIDDSWQLRLAVKDLLDEEGSYVSGYRAAGRTLRLTLSYQGN